MVFRYYYKGLRYSLKTHIIYIMVAGNERIVPFILIVIVRSVVWKLETLRGRLRILFNNVIKNSEVGDNFFFNIHFRMWKIMCRICEVLFIYKKTVCVISSTLSDCYWLFLKLIAFILSPFLVIWNGLLENRNMPIFLLHILMWLYNIGI